MVSNYRPISLLTILSKIYEKICYTRLSDFLTKKKFLVEFQFGFRIGHTTSMAILTLLDRVIEALKNKEYTIGIFLDFSKAFDTVNHNILIKKLEAYGITGIASKWL